MKKILLAFLLLLIATRVEGNMVKRTESDPLALKTAGTDNVKDTHIDWGTGAGQVSASDMPDEDIGDITITGGNWAIDDSVAVTSWNLTTPTITTSATVSDGATLGLGTGKGLIQFDDETIDFVSFSNCNVGIGTTGPGTKLDVDLGASGNVQDNGITLTRGTGYVRLTSRTTDTSDFLPAIIGKPVGDTISGMLFRGLRTAEMVDSAPSFVLQSANPTNDGVITDNQVAIAFRNWLTDLVTIKGGGNVGIGTTEPSSALDVIGDLEVGGTDFFVDDSTGKVGIGRTDPTYGRLEIAQLSNAFNQGLGVTNAGRTNGIYFWADGSDDAILSSGNVNVLSLHTSGNVGLGGSITNTSTFAGASMVIKSGNVGIGTTSPSVQVEVSKNYLGGADALLPQVKVINTNTTTTGYGSVASLKVAAGNGTVEGWLTANNGVTQGNSVDFRVITNHNFNIWTNNTKRLTVLNSGNVGIGTTGPESLLEIQAIEATDAILTLDCDDGDDNADTWFIASEAATNNLTFDNHTTEVATLSSAGNLQINGDLDVDGNDIDIGDAGGFSGFKFTPATTTLDVYIDGNKIGHFATDGTYTNDVP